MGAVLARLFGHGEGLHGGHHRLVLGEHTVVIERQLATGGFSTVYLVRDTSDVLRGEHKQHAPTMVLKELICPTEERLSYARTEASALRRVKHHNVIRLLDSAEIQDRVYLLLPFYERGTLQQQVENQGAVEESEALLLLSGICTGLLQLLQLEPPLAHRDLKPGNILLSNEGDAVLMDLGSAFAAQQSLSSHREAMALQERCEELCTMSYRAPELFEVFTQSVVDERSDVWSLGCIMYFMQYTMGPFDEAYSKGGSIKLAAVGGNIKFAPQPVRTSGYTALMKAMLQVDPTLRPTVAQALERIEALQRGDTLEEALATSSPAATPTTMTTTTTTTTTMTTPTTSSSTTAFVGGDIADAFR